jgi:hypothetical protein
MKPESSIIPHQPVEDLIRTIRGQRVIFDSDLAKVYGVTTARLNQQVRRNADRFPADFAFQLTSQEFAALMLQFATSKTGRGGRRKLPLAFTEHGAFKKLMEPVPAVEPERREIGFHVRANVSARRASKSLKP